MRRAALAHHQRQGGETRGIGLGNRLAVVVDQTPLNTSLPVVTGTATQGETLSVTDGTWDPTRPPTSFAYSWQRCSGADCVSIDGALAESLVGVSRIAFGRVRRARGIGH